MSTVHGSPYWNPTALNVQGYNAIEEKGGMVRGWEIKEYTVITQKMQIWGYILITVFKNIFAIAENTVKNAPNEKRGLPFVVNPIISFNAVTEQLNKNSSYKGKTKTLIKVISNLAEEYIINRRGINAVLLTNDNALTLLNQFMFNYSMQQEDLIKWQKRMYIDCSTYFYNTILKIKSLGICSFSIEDLVFLDEVKGSDKIDPTKISCIAYALLKIKEVQAKKLIMDTEHDLVLEIETLKNWEYRIVDHPNDGDLVLYMNPKSPIVMHLGIFRDDEKTCQGLVESKWGFDNSEVYLHPIFDIPPNYGKIVVFMRKNKFIIARDDEKK